jgi:hypothetical protein
MMAAVCSCLADLDAAPYCQPDGMMIRCRIDKRRQGREAIDGIGGDLLRHGLDSE